MFKKTYRWLILTGLLAVMFSCGGPLKDFDYIPFQPATYFLPCQYAGIEGLQVAYVESGPAGAPGLIFIHGLLGRLDNWRFNVPAFADRYHVLALDLPGFGNSDKADRDMTMEFYAQVVKGLMDQKGMPKATLVGNSMGGEVAALFAIRYPDRVDKLVLVDSAGLMRAPFFARLASRHTNKIADWIVRKVQKKFKNQQIPDVYFALHERLFNPKRPHRAQIAFDMKNPNVAETLDFFCLQYSTLMKTREFEWHVKDALRAFRSLLKTHLEHQLVAIKAPTLIVWGDQDQLIPPKFAELFHKGIAGSKMVLIKDTGHVPMIEKPDQFNKALGDFLGGA